VGVGRLTAPVLLYAGSIGWTVPAKPSVASRTYLQNIWCGGGATRHGGSAAIAARLFFYSPVLTFSGVLYLDVATRLNYRWYDIIFAFSDPAGGAAVYGNHLLALWRSAASISGRRGIRALSVAIWLQ